MSTGGAQAGTPGDRPRRRGPAQRRLTGGYIGSDLGELADEAPDFDEAFFTIKDDASDGSENLEV